VKLILDLHTSQNRGVRRIQSELPRRHAISLALATIHKVLQRHHVKLIRKYRKKKGFIRYECSILGDRVQMDACKIALGLYQYISIDDCNR
jgi:hypothetical protein